MWNKVEEQGIDPEDVARFALLPKFMNRKQLRDFRDLRFAKNPKENPCRPTHANCVIMKSGDVVSLNPWIELP